MEKTKLMSLCVGLALQLLSVGTIWGNPVNVYFHGFGEGWPSVRNRGPVFSDAPGNMLKASWCTKNHVHEAAQYLKKKINEENATSFHIDGRSCGGGATLNLLGKLTASYSKGYWKGSGITEQDCKDIFARINKGSVHLTVPF